MFNLFKNEDGTYSGMTFCVSCARPLVFVHTKFPRESDTCSPCIIAADPPAEWLAAYNG